LTSKNSRKSFRKIFRNFFLHIIVESVLHPLQKNWPITVKKSCSKSKITFFFYFNNDFRNRNIATRSPNLTAQAWFSVLDLLQKTFFPELTQKGFDSVSKFGPVFRRFFAIFSFFSLWMSDSNLSPFSSFLISYLMQCLTRKNFFLQKILIFFHLSVFIKKN
jgi:hypothetical protein